ncbi:DUF6538 domain-containing protein [Vogesella indigofera]|uniref:DUF6538 domain-containing protein n=1 Tax=Vogesella indigofera TaxID=45465 RepID=UPI00234E50E2|nr:DUF6538 domain-containing protein [Vogesella indigofera]MDC7707272.1 hypothetical protein [Vogesella indigofera]
MKISKLLVFNGFFLCLLPVGATHTTDKAMTKTTHVVRRGATYYFRLRVPADLVEHYGKQEITFSLQTKDQEEAKRKGLKEALRHMDEFESVRKALKCIVMASMSPEEIQEVAHSLAHELLSEDESKRIYGQRTEEYRIGIEVVEENVRPILAGEWDYNDGDCRRWITKAVRNHFDRIGLSVTPQSDLEQMLIHACATALVEAIDIIKGRDKGKLVATPNVLAKAPARPLVRPAQDKADKRTRYRRTSASSSFTLFDVDGFCPAALESSSVIH